MSQTSPQIPFPSENEGSSNPFCQSGSSPPQSATGAANDDVESLFPPAPRRSDAEKFIEALAGDVNARVTFQTFHDSIKGNGGRILHGTLAEHLDTLVAVNQGGHGIYILVNEGDSKGRTKANVIALRAVFIDDDGKNAPVAYQGDGLAPFEALPPTITVQSKAGQHNYFQLVAGEALERFTPIQENLAAHFGTDSAVKDLSRVMRLPGFFHMKNPEAPFLVKLVQTRPERYTLGQLLTAYPAPGKKKTPNGKVESKAGPCSLNMARARKYVAKVPPAIEGEGGDAKTFNLCATLTRGFNLTDDECMAVLHDWNEACQPPWSKEDLRIKIQNGREHGTEEIGGRLKAKGTKSATGPLPTEFASLCALFRNPDQRKLALGADGELEMDVRTRAVTLARKPYGQDVEISVIRENLTKHFRPEGWDKKFEFTKENVVDALQRVAAEKTYHPVQDYLNSLKWDGKQRISQVPSNVLGLPPDDPWGWLNAVLLKRWFISAVARAMKPGCKVDTVLILVGKQGRRKSMFFSVLGGEWFTDSPVDMENKDGMLLLGKTWIVELAELDSMARARNHTAVKAFISRQVDAYRPPYGRVTVEVPRTSVFVGTTNEDEFLTDATGNRRYWPISGCDKGINVELLREWRDQLWAEAAQLYRDGEQWHLTEGEEQQLTEKLRDHERLDPWHRAIAEHVEGKSEVRTNEILSTCLNIARDRQGRAEEMRVASTLKLLGFRVARVPGKDGKRERIWVRE